MKKLKVLGRKMDNKIIGLKASLVSKRPGDGHYVAIAISLLLALAIGAIIWAVVGGNNGMIATWINNIVNRVTDFINQITS